MNLRKPGTHQVPLHPMLLTLPMGTMVCLVDITIIKALFYTPGYYTNDRKFFLESNLYDGGNAGIGIIHSNLKQTIRML
jgi:hypothetical protein